MKYSISNLIVELTRRCNMSCPHCLRGEAQNLDFDIKYLRKFLKQVSYINSLTLTGGEPSLVPHLIEQVVEALKEADVRVGSFYMVTNARHITPDFMMAILKLHLYTDDGEDSNSLQISNDAYHEGYDENGVRMLKAFRFTSMRQDTDGDDYDARLLMEGRAVDYYSSNHYERFYPLEIDGESIDCEALYLNCRGMLLGSCDLSYESQDIEAIQIASMDKRFELGAAIRRYNRRIKAGINDTRDLRQKYFKAA